MGSLTGVASGDVRSHVHTGHRRISTELPYIVGFAGIAGNAGSEAVMVVFGLSLLRTGKSLQCEMVGI